MKIRLSKTSGVTIGALRVSEELNHKLEALAKKGGVNRQEVIRAILENVIDDVTL